VQIDIYGRGNNAYRWAGESDVFEALEDLMAREQQKFQRPMIDPRKVVLKGFSMGGAGTWHIGLRHPGKFAAIQPGAGFTTTHGYIAGLPNPLPPHQEACLKIYDALNYAENAANLPIVAYSGEIDKQRLAAENIEKRVKELQLIERFTHLIGPGLEHKFPPEWQQKAEAELQKYVGGNKARPINPPHIHVVTYMPMANDCDGVRIEALEKQYQKAEIDATYDEMGCVVKTNNVRCMSLSRQGRRNLTIDGVKIDARSSDFIKIDGKWVNQYDGEPFKRTATSGPIDHAFTTKFLCIIGTGKAFNPEMESAARAQLDRFQREWDKHMRGVLVVKKDTDITRADIAVNNLILFGDPGSNSVIAQYLPKLPLKWTAKSIEFRGTTYDSATHLPVLIYPNPTSGGRYIVFNSGHTFHDAEFKGTNAQLYPRLGDYALIKPIPTSKAPAGFEVVTAGLFDEAWKISAK
jgi:predicted esterase